MALRAPPAYHSRVVMTTSSDTSQSNTESRTNITEGAKPVYTPNVTLLSK